MTTILTLMAGRFYAIEPYFWGLSIIDHPKDQLHLLFLTNSDQEGFIRAIESRITHLTGYASVRFLKTDAVKPSSNAFIERGIHVQEHSEVIATLYNLAYQHIETENILLLEDDVIAPSNVMRLADHLNDGTGYACGTVMCRHNGSLFAWDLGYKSVFGEKDTCQEKSYYGADIKKPWGVREIGLGHFGLTMLRKSVCDQLPKPTFRPISNHPGTGALRGCDMVACLEMGFLGYQCVCDFNVRGLHLSSDGKVH